MIYCAICTSFWMPGDIPDENYTSENFEEVISFCIKRQDRNKAAFIIKCDNQKEEIIVSFRSLK
jgi:hypothetical protein